MNRPWAPIPTTTLIFQSQITNQNMMYNWKQMSWTWILSRTRTLDKMHPQHKILKSRWSYPRGERFGQGFHHLRRSSNICIHNQANHINNISSVFIISSSQLTKSVDLLPQTSAMIIIDDHLISPSQLTKSVGLLPQTSARPPVTTLPIISPMKYKLLLNPTFGEE